MRRKNRTGKTTLTNRIQKVDPVYFRIIDQLEKLGIKTIETYATPEYKNAMKIRGYLVLAGIHNFENLPAKWNQEYILGNTKISYNLAVEVGYARRDLFFLMDSFSEYLATR